MVFGPPSTVPLDAGRSEQPGLELRAREVGVELASALAAAERLTQDWKRARLGQALVDVALSKALCSLAALECWGRDNQLASSELWQAAKPWLERGSLQMRARSKPRGYAGDYELLEQLWDRTVSPDPLGRHFDHYFQGQAAVHAVRARIEQAAAAIVAHRLERPQEPYRVLDIGSGPAIELALAAETLAEADSQPITFRLLDLDDAALENARRRLAERADPSRIECHRENLFRLSSLGRAEPLVSEVDFCLSLGFFDYLEDEAATALLERIWRGLRAGGMLLVGNFLPGHASRAYMEWFGNWYLIYRTAEQLAQLALRAGIPQACVTVGAERTGIDLFLCARKEARPK